MLFQIPDGIMAYHLFSTTVALAGGEALTQKPGFKLNFSSLVPNLGHLMCEFVGAGPTHQIVNLFDFKGQNIAEIVLKMCDGLLPKLKTLPLAPLAIPKIEVTL